MPKKGLRLHLTTSLVIFGVGFGHLSKFVLKDTFHSQDPELAFLGTATALYFPNDIPFYISLPWIAVHGAFLLCFFAWPRWYTACISMIAVYLWYWTGEIIGGIAC